VLSGIPVRVIRFGKELQKMLSMHVVGKVRKVFNLSCKRFPCVICLFVATLNYSINCLASDNQNTKAIKMSAKPRVLQITLYGSGLMTGYTRIDFPTRALHVSGLQIRGPGWRRYDAKVTPEETRKLIQLVNKVDLRSFQPKAEWFEAPKGLSEGSAYLAVKWDDKERIFRMAKDTDKKVMPKEARHYYEVIGEISSYISRMENKYEKKAKVVRIDKIDEDQDCREFLERLDEVFRIALPTPRKQAGEYK
jgi:hypothetical protein